MAVSFSFWKLGLPRAVDKFNLYLSDILKQEDWISAKLNSLFLFDRNNWKTIF